MVEGSLRAVVNWQYELPLGEGFDGLKMLVHLKDGEGELLDTKEVDWPATSVELELNPSLPWETNISLQTAVLNSALEEAGERKLFGGEMELLPPKEGSVKVEHRVTQDGGLEAIISWENNMDPVFDHLQTVVEVTDGETGYLCPGSPAGFSSAMLRFLHKPQLKDSMGAEGTSMPPKDPFGSQNGENVQILTN